MYQTQSTSRLHVHLVISTFAALCIALVPFAMAADQTVTATVTAVNTLSINSSTLALSPTTAMVASDSSSTLTFATNDGQTHKITVTAPLVGWAFVPTVAESLPNTFPELTVSATSTEGNASSTTVVLITALNAGNTPRDVVTGIKSTTGTATVTLEASITQTVVAGTYTTTLTYEFVAY